MEWSTRATSKQNKAEDNESHNSSNRGAGADTQDAIILKVSRLALCDNYTRGTSVGVPRLLFCSRSQRSAVTVLLGSSLEGVILKD